MMIRRYEPSDWKTLLELFYDTVHTVNRSDYTREQLDAWAPDREADPTEWGRTLSEAYTLVAVAKGALVGFGSIGPTGYLDMLFVHKDFQRKGIAAALCDRLEGAVDVPAITTHASLTAKPFFEKRGYRIVREQQVVRKGVLLTNCMMEKRRRA